MRRSHKHNFDNLGCFIVLFLFFAAVIFNIVLDIVRPKPSRSAASLPSTYSASSPRNSSSSSGPSRPHIDDGKVYVTATGECYHRSWCSSLDQSKIDIDLDDAVEKGYRPCRRCNPPVS